MTGDANIKTGSCLCGAVRYRVTGPMRQVVNCHCGQCRKQTGHFLSATGVRLKYFELTEDRGLQWYEASATAKRGFCHECGAFLFWQPNGGERIAIAAGSLDGPTGLSTAAHIFVADKGDYYELDDGVPCYPQSGDDHIPYPE